MQSDSYQLSLKDVSNAIITPHKRELELFLKNIFTLDKLVEIKSGKLIEK